MLRRNLKFVLTFNFLLIVSVVTSQVQLVKDINTTPAGIQSDADFSNPFCYCGESVYFPFTNALGTELWKSDGTEEGTRMVVDLNRYSGSGVGTHTKMICKDNKLYFYGDDGSHGLELWTTDGTEIGTQMVRDLLPGQSAYTLSEPVLFNGKVGFVGATDQVVRLWVSDGTDQGTQSVVVAPGIPGEFNVTEIASNSQYIYFTMLRLAQGQLIMQLWRSDGSQEGTIMLMEVNTFFFQLVATQKDAYFLLEQELWRSDGTAAGTHSVMSLPGGHSRLYPYQDKVVFNSQSTLWVSDGTGAFTSALTDCVIYAAREVSDEFIVLGYSPILHANVLVRTKGTIGTTTVLNLGDAELYSPYSNVEQRTIPVVDGDLFATLYSPVSGWEPYKITGNYSQAELTSDIVIGEAGSHPRSWVEAGGRAYFLANDGELGRELWITDGTSSGTKLVKNIRPGNENGFQSNFLEVLNDSLFFFGYPTVFGQPWKLMASNGLETGTAVYDDISQGPHYLGRDSNHLYYVGRDYTNDNGHRLMQADGTTGGVKEIRRLDNSGGWIGLARGIGGRFIFETYGNDSGYELWVTDGTESGTQMLKDINLGTASGASLPTSGGENFVNTLFFPGNNGSIGSELWATDGTPDGTRLVKDINPGSQPSSPNEFALIEDVVLFAATTATNGRELWRTDGTEEGTWLVKDISTLEVTDSSNPSQLVSLNGAVYYAAVDSSAGWALWKSDGTSDGTVRVKDVSPGNGFNKTISSLCRAGTELFFVADDAIHGFELWVSDGTADGTRLLDINPGPEGSHPSLLTPIDNFIYFQAIGSMWRTDGTTENTNKVADIEPRTHIRYLNGWIYFDAYTDAYGWELYKVPYTKFDPQIVLLPISEEQLSSPTYTIDASSSSETSVEFTGSDNTSIVENQLIVTSPGRVIVNVVSPENEFYNAAQVEYLNYCYYPPKPTITVDESGLAPVLTSSSEEDNIWYMDGVVIDDSGSQSIEVEASGVYSVQVIADDCESEISDGVNAVITALESGPTHHLRISPNPASDRLVLYSSFDGRSQLIGMTGKTHRAIAFKSSVETELMVSDLPRGIYFLKCELANKVHVLKVVLK